MEGDEDTKFMLVLTYYLGPWQFEKMVLQTILFNIY